MKIMKTIEDIINMNKEFTPEDFTFFWQGPLSQWHKCHFIWRFDYFNCAEQYMMYNKATFFQDYETAKKIMKSSNPKEQKSLGKKIKNFNPKEWDEVKKEIVIEGNYCKFSQNENLKKILLNTKDRILVEASPFDKVWGIGLPQNNKHILNPRKWKGKNLLGFCLMEVRESLK